MSYSPTTWTTGDTITATKLNNIESGISAVESDVSTLNTSVNGIASDVSDVEITVSNLTSTVSTLDSDVDDINEVLDAYIGKEGTYTFSSTDTRLTDGRVHYTDGVVEGTGTGYFLCATINVVPGYQVIFTPCNTGSYAGSTYANQFGYAFYDSEGSYISGAPGTVDQVNSITVPPGAFIFKYGRQKNNWDTTAYSTIEVRATRGHVSQITWNAVGDSVTANGQYLTAIKMATGLNPTNLGVHSSSVAINSSAVENQSFVERIPSYTDADIWTVFGGVNDVYAQSSLGALTSIGSTYDSTTVYGAYQTIVENILGRRNQPRLLLITPYHNREESKTKSENGITLAEVVKAIEDVGELYGVPVINLMKTSGINEFNWEHANYPTTVDRLHPTDNGGRMMAGPILFGMKILLYDML